MKYLAEMTFAEVGAVAKDAAAILPVGAIEAHGPHLPLLTDVIIARGMAAALPHIDVFQAGHNLQSLEEVAEVIARG